MKTVELNDQERRALNEFIGERWSQFQVVAERYLTDDETEALGEKLEDWAARGPNVEFRRLQPK